MRASAVALSLDLSAEELLFGLPLDSWQDCADRRLAATNPHPFPVPFRWEPPAGSEYAIAPLDGVLQPRKSAEFGVRCVRARHEPMRRQWALLPVTSLFWTGLSAAGTVTSLQHSLQQAAGARPA